jgi:hypothetical protein
MTSPTNHTEVLRRHAEDVFYPGEYYRDLFNSTLDILAQEGAKTKIGEIENLNEELYEYSNLDALKEDLDDRVDRDYLDSSISDTSKIYRSTGNYIINAKFGAGDDNYVEIYKQTDSDNDEDIDSISSIGKIFIRNNKTFVSEDTSQANLGFYISNDSYFVLPDGTDILLNLDNTGKLIGIKIKDDNKLAVYGKSVLDDSSEMNSMQLYDLDPNYDHYKYVKDRNGNLNFPEGAAKFIWSAKSNSDSGGWNIDVNNLYYDLDSNALRDNLFLVLPETFLREEVGVAPNIGDELRKTSLELALNVPKDSEQLGEAFGIVLEYGSAKDVIDFYYDNYREIRRTLASIKYARDKENPETWLSQLSKTLDLIATEKKKIDPYNTGVLGKMYYAQLDESEQVNWDQLISGIIKSIGTSSGTGSVLRESLETVLEEVFYGKDTNGDGIIDQAALVNVDDSNLDSVTQAINTLISDEALPQRGIITQLKEQIQVIQELEKVRDVMKYGDAVSWNMLVNGSGTTINGLTSILGEDLEAAGFMPPPKDELVIETWPPELSQVLNKEDIDNLIGYAHSNFRFKISNVDREAKELMTKYASELQNQINVLDPLTDGNYIKNLEQVSKGLGLDVSSNFGSNREKALENFRELLDEKIQSGSFQEIYDLTSSKWRDIVNYFSEDEISDLIEDIRIRRELDSLSEEEAETLIEHLNYLISRKSGSETIAAPENTPPKKTPFVTENYINLININNSGHPVNEAGDFTGYNSDRIDEIISVSGFYFREVESEIKKQADTSLAISMISQLEDQISAIESKGALDSTDNSRISELQFRISRYRSAAGL